MEQYQLIKKEHPTEILFFRLGDFYEMFYDDARTASKVLSLTLTSRYKGDKAVPMAGVPFHSANNYINKLLKAGYKIAICEQLEEADSAKGDIIERGVIRILTPGTLVEDNLLETHNNNFLAALTVKNKQAGLAWVDISTGLFQITEGETNDIISELIRLDPSEYLIPQYLIEENNKVTDQFKGRLNGTLTSFHDWTFNKDNAYKNLTAHFGVKNLSGFGCEDYHLGISSAGAIIEYLKGMQSHSPLESPMAMVGLKHITKITPFIRTNHLIIDRNTQRALELTRTIQGDETNTLFAILNKTATGMGARLLKEWILRPLREVNPINERLSAVGFFLASPSKRQSLQKELRKVSDVERIAARLGTGRASPRDITGLKSTLLLMPALRKLISPTANENNLELVNNIYSGLAPLNELTDYIDKALVDEPPLGITEGGMIREGFDPELDKIRSISREGKQWIAKFEADEVKRTGITSLKVGFNNVFGYYIEITNTHKEKVPVDYVCKQTLKNAERYITPQLKDYETQVLHAEERINKIEYELFKQVRTKVAEHILDLQKTASAIASLDVILSLAQAAQENNYIKPVITDKTNLKITDGRHPVIEKLENIKFIPNDTILDTDENKVILLTGPNMAGKSTYIRQVALLVLMAQAGSFIPAREAEIGVVDRIFTRVGASDELTRGSSTFMVEMNEVAHILNNATKTSLIILDEVGRGTSTFDGVSIAWAVTEYIHDHIGSRTLFATHYHELTELSLILPGIKNYHVQVKEWNTAQGEQIVFLHKVALGGTDKSYGIQVARLAGLPKGLIDRARLILTNLEAQTLDEKDLPRFAPTNTKNIPPADPFQLSLFHNVPSNIIKILKDIEPDQLTPMEALAKLQELKKELDRKK
jgi:DNA mismatch repair protein MutS